MPLGFLTKDFLRVPIRPPPGTLGISKPLIMEHKPPIAEQEPPITEPVITATPVVTAPEPDVAEEVEETPLPANNIHAVIPAGFEELPMDAVTRQGTIYKPNAPAAPALHRRFQAPSWGRRGGEYGRRGRSSVAGFFGRRVQRGRMD
jgi:hypothetical protein